MKKSEYIVFKDNEIKLGLTAKNYEEALKTAFRILGYELFVQTHPENKE